MPTNNATNNAKSNRKRDAQPNGQAAGSGTRIRVEATRRKRVDPDMIALCYWLIAQRIVQTAGDEADAAQPRGAQTTDNDDQATDRAALRSDS